MRRLGWLQRHWLIVTASVLLLALALCVAYWQLSRFPAEVEAIEGTPFELAIQPGVPDVAADQVRAGLRAMDA